MAKQLLVNHANHQAALSVPISLASRPITVLAAGVIDGADSGLNDPTAFSNLVQNARVFTLPNNLGTTLKARLLYDDGLSAITDPVLLLFGRTRASSGDSSGAGGSNDVDQWRLLPTLDGSRTATLATDATDIEWGTSGLKATTPTNDQAWDRDGCDEFMFAVSTALSGTGTVDSAAVQAWIV